MKCNLIIGAGQLGSRHLQALLKLECPQRIFVLDPQTSSLELSKTRAEEVISTSEVFYLNDWANLPSKFDLVIVATSANVRSEICMKLLKNYYFDFLILEKVLFQDLKSYEEISSILIDKNIRVWVNHPRREWNIYQKLKKDFQGENRIIKIEATGSNWGLASNSLHLIDLCAYLSSSEIEILNLEGIDKLLYNSKRTGYIEFNGVLSGKMRNGVEILFTSFNFEKVESYITIYTPIAKYIIHEGSAQLYKLSMLDRTDVEFIKFDIEQQSTLTTNIARRIFNDGESDLPLFLEASATHKYFVKEFLRKYNHLTGTHSLVLPIT